LPKCKIIAGTAFDKELKRLAKRYASITNDLAKLLPVLEENPRHGTSLGGD
jgi:hypothetical protein